MNPYDRTRMQFFTIISILLVILVSSCKSEFDRPLRIGFHSWPGYASLFLAQEEKWIDSQQISLVEYSNSSQTSSSLFHGMVDGGALTLDETLKLMAEGVDLKVVAVLDFSTGSDSIMAHPDKVKDGEYKGTRVGVENAALGAIMLDAFLVDQGLSPQDVLILSMPPNEQIDAYQKGQIDLAVTYEPYASHLEDLGAQKVFDSSQIPGRIVDVLAFRSKVLQERPKEVEQVVQAHFRALKEIVSNPTASYSIMAPFLEVPKEKVPSFFDGIYIPTLQENQNWLHGANPKLNLVARELVEFLENRSLLDKVNLNTSLAEATFLLQEVP